MQNRAMKPSDYEQLLRLCYQGPIEEQLWRSFLYALKDTLQASYVTLMLRPPKDDDMGVLLNAHELKGKGYNSYIKRFHAQNPFVDLPVNKAVTVDDVLNMHSFKQSEYYQNYLKIAFSCAGAKIQKI